MPGCLFTVNAHEQYHLCRDQAQCGKPQGSVLGPLIFTLYLAPVGNIIWHHGLQFHIYADDMQLYVAFNPQTLVPLAVTKQSVVTCIWELCTWIICNRLQFNDDKTKALLLCNQRLCHHADVTTTEVGTGNNSVTFSETARNLCAIFDSAMGMGAHASSPCCSGYMNIWTISCIWHMLPQCAWWPGPRSLITEIWFSISCTGYLFSTGFHVFKILLLTYRAMHDLVPAYLEPVGAAQPCFHSVVISRQVAAGCPSDLQSEIGRPRLLHVCA